MQSYRELVNRMSRLLQLYEQSPYLLSFFDQSACLELSSCLLLMEERLGPIHFKYSMLLAEYPER